MQLLRMALNTERHGSELYGSSELGCDPWSVIWWVESLYGEPFVSWVIFLRAFVGSLLRLVEVLALVLVVGRVAGWLRRPDRRRERRGAGVGLRPGGW